jgi:hypothetical protein
MVGSVHQGGGQERGGDMNGEHDAIDRDRALLAAVRVAVAAFGPRPHEWFDESADERV